MSTNANKNNKDNKHNHNNNSQQNPKMDVEAYLVKIWKQGFSSIYYVNRPMIWGYYPRWYQAWIFLHNTTYYLPKICRTIVFFNLIFCVLFFEEHLNLPVADHSTGKLYFCILIFGAKLWLFIMATYRFITALRFGSFGLTAKQSFVNRKEHFPTHIFLMTTWYVAYILILYLLPDAESYFITHNL